jgi:hypothetical protein
MKKLLLLFLFIPVLTFGQKSNFNLNRTYNKEVSKELTSMSYYQKKVSKIEVKHDFAVCLLPSGLENRETLEELNKRYGDPFELENKYYYRWKTKNVVIEFIPYDGVYFYEKKYWLKNK